MFTFYLVMVAVWPLPVHIKKLRGKVSSPSRSIVSRVIFITVAVIFIFRTWTYKSILCAMLGKVH